jgi:RHS repeat-associated protein
MYDESGHLLGEYTSTGVLDEETICMGDIPVAMFGTVAPAQNPGGLGTFAYNLRFPGQYYQAETGLNYNYVRDYDPADRQIRRIRADRPERGKLLSHRMVFSTLAYWCPSAWASRPCASMP